MSMKPPCVSHVWNPQVSSWPFITSLLALPVMVNLCVNFSGPQHPHVWSNIILDNSVFKLVDIERADCPLSGGRPHPVSWRLREKRISPPRKQELCQQMAFGLELKYQLPASTGELVLKTNPSLFLFTWFGLFLWRILTTIKSPIPHQPHSTPHPSPRQVPICILSL